MKKRYLLILVSGLLSFALFQNFTTNEQGLILPDFPLRNLDTRTLKRNASGLYETQTPHLPIHEMTLDGRIGILKRGDPEGVPFFIMKPENVIEHLGSLRNEKVGINLLDSEPNAILNLKLPAIRDRINLDRAFVPGRSFFCEKTERKNNPYLCNGTNDCYNLTLVTRFDKENTTPYGTAVLTSVDFTLEISNPKTKNAQVVRLTPNLNSIRQGPEFMFPKFAEPVIVGDGRLLIFRLGDANNGTTGETKIYLSDRTTEAGKGIDIVYSSYRTFETEGGVTRRTEQCDVAKWTPGNTHPISSAYFDTFNNMRSRYKFARYPMSDNIGRFVPNGVDLGGSYPWMDRDAANLFFTAGGKDGFYNIAGTSIRIPYAENDAISYAKPAANAADIDLFEEVFSNTASIYMAGFWTYGKTILLDGLINNVDYNLRIADRDVGGEQIPVERQWKIYTTRIERSEQQEYEPMGGVRELGDVFDKTMYHPKLTPNSSFLGSIENRFHYLDQMRPVTPRDLVWHFGSTRHSEEVVFDEYVSPYVLINAEMTGASSTNYNIEDPLADPVRIPMRYYDGIFRGVKQRQAAVPAVTDDAPVDGQLYFQNAVAHPPGFLNPPRFGEPIGNPIGNPPEPPALRLEPLAKGGIHGKGLWLNGNTGLKFTIPDQTGSTFSVRDAPLYSSVFVDLRETDRTTRERVLVSAVNGGQIVLARSTSQVVNGVFFDKVVLKNSAGTVLSEITLGSSVGLPNEKWVNVGVAFPRTSPPKLYINGSYVNDFRPTIGTRIVDVNNALQIMPATVAAGAHAIILGASANTSPTLSVRGWVDDFKVVLRIPSPEEICNYARGTIADMSSVTESVWINEVNKYPLASGRLTNEFPALTGAKYLCVTRYGSMRRPLHADPLFSHFKNLPPGAVSVRENILLRNKDLVYGKPRPDFTKNRFCLSCHLPAVRGSFAEMDTLALTLGTVKSEDDPRRQPSQSPGIFRGVVPAGYFGVGKPSQPMYGDEFKVDQWIAPGN